MDLNNNNILIFDSTLSANVRLRVKDNGLEYSLNNSTFHELTPAEGLLKQT
jgi:hypothetical protein